MAAGLHLRLDTQTPHAAAASGDRRLVANGEESHRLLFARRAPWTEFARRLLMGDRQPAAKALQPDHLVPIRTWLTGCRLARARLCRAAGFADRVLGFALDLLAQSSRLRPATSRGPARFPLDTALDLLDLALRSLRAIAHGESPFVSLMVLDVSYPRRHAPNRTPPGFVQQPRLEAAVSPSPVYLHNLQAVTTAAQVRPTPRLGVPVGLCQFPGVADFSP